MNYKYRNAVFLVCAVLVGLVLQNSKVDSWDVKEEEEAKHTNNEDGRDEEATDLTEDDEKVFRRNRNDLLENLATVRGKTPSQVKIAVVIKNVMHPVELAQLLTTKTKTETLPLTNRNNKQHNNLIPDYVMVEYLKTAEEMRAVNITTPLLVMYPVRPEDAFRAHQDGLAIEFIVNGLWWIQKYRQIASSATKVASDNTKQQPLKVHLFVDSGMGRDGGLPEEMIKAAREITSGAEAKKKRLSSTRKKEKRDDNIQITGVMTHLCCK